MTKPNLFPKRKLGRPRKDGTAEPAMASINFKADPETVTALAELELDYAAVRGRRSNVLRRIILDAKRDRDRIRNQ